MYSLSLACSSALFCSGDVVGDLADDIIAFDRAMWWVAGYCIECGLAADINKDKKTCDKCGAKHERSGNNSEA